MYPSLDLALLLNVGLLSIDNPNSLFISDSDFPNVFENGMKGNDRHDSSDGDGIESDTAQSFPFG